MFVTIFSIIYLALAIFILGRYFNVSSYFQKIKEVLAQKFDTSEMKESPINIADEDRYKPEFN